MIKKYLVKTIIVDRKIRCDYIIVFIMKKLFFHNDFFYNGKINFFTFKLCKNLSVCNIIGLRLIQE